MAAKTKEKLKAIHNLTNKGKTIAEIADELKCKYDNIYHILKHYFIYKGSKVHYNEKAVKLLNLYQVEPTVSNIKEIIKVTQEQKINNPIIINLDGIHIRFEQGLKKDVYINKNNVITIK